MATESNMKTLFDTRTLKQEAWLKCKDSLVNLVKQFCFISTDDDEAEFSPSQEEELFKDKNAAGIVIVQDVTKDSAKVAYDAEKPHCKKIIVVLLVWQLALLEWQ